MTTFSVVLQHSLLFDMAQLTVAEYRRSLMALAEALAEPGRRFSPDEVMLKGHELNPGQYGQSQNPFANTVTNDQFILIRSMSSVLYL